MLFLGDLAIQHNVLAGGYPLETQSDYSSHNKFQSPRVGQLPWNILWLNSRPLHLRTTFETPKAGKGNKNAKWQRSEMAARLKTFGQGNIYLVL